MVLDNNTEEDDGESDNGVAGVAGQPDGEAPMEEDRNEVADDDGQDAGPPPDVAPKPKSMFDD